MKLLKKIAAATISAALVLTGGFEIANINFNDISLTASAYENQIVCESMLKLINNERTAAGLNKLKLYPELCNRANTRAIETATLFDHARPDGTSCFTILNGITYNSAGENIAYNSSSTPSQAMNQWMNSAGHKANILNTKFTHVGIGMYKSGSRYYWTQMFLGYSGSYSGEYIPVDYVGTPYVKGDADGSCTVDALDAATVLTYYAATQINMQPSLSDKERTAADVNGDGSIDATDASSILSYYASVSTGQVGTF